MRFASPRKAIKPSGGGLIVAIFIAAALFAIGALAVSYFDDSTVRVTVVSKEAVTKNGNSTYRVHGTDETYVMKDSLIKMRYRTSNDYGRIKEGVTYECTAFGWRIPFFSMFENIRDCKAVTP